MTAVALVALAVVAIVLAHPVAKFDAFKSNSAATLGTDTTNHLLNSSGSGRWQFWSAAVSEFRAHPLNGGGAGSWQAWWLQHGSLQASSPSSRTRSISSRSRSSGSSACCSSAAPSWSPSSAPFARPGCSRAAEVAAAAACGIAFFVAAAYDWVWQLAGIAVVGVGMLGFALGALPSTRATAWGRFGALRPALALVAVAAIIPQYVVLAAGSHLRNSQAAFNAGDAATGAVGGARGQGDRALGGEPYLQLGFVSEAEGHLPAASHWLDEAIRRSPRDYPCWLIAARIEGERGRARGRGARPARGAPALSELGGFLRKTLSGDLSRAEATVC